MKNKILIGLLIVFSFHSFGQTTTYIDPSGYYTLDSKVTKKNGETYGYFGDIKVLSIGQNKVLMSFFVCKGAPSYNSGSFVDTLTYLNNIVIYNGDPDADTTCVMTMKFNANGVDVDLKTENPNFACGFGHAVDSQGFYNKDKSGVPKKEEILNDNR